METSDQSLIQSSVTSSQEDFLASLSVAPGSREARRMTVISGRRCCALLKKQHPLGCLARTFLESSRWNSTTCYLTWKASATPRGRLLFRLAPSMLDTDETECGLWATANSRDWKDTPGMATEATNPDGTNRDRIDQLARQVYQIDAHGSLNPQFVSWLMGYPLDWCDMPDELQPKSRTESKSLKDSGMPSSRRSPTKSCTKSEK